VVPRTWVNDKVFFEGLAPEKYLLKAVRQALDPAMPKGRVVSSE